MIRNKLVHRISLGLFAFVMFAGGVADLLFAPPVAEAAASLGFPEYLMRLVGTWKVLGVLAILAPIAKGRLREWAWAGFFFDLSGAFVSHLAAGDGFAAAFPALLFLGVGAVAYLSTSETDTFPAARPAPVAVAA